MRPLLTDTPSSADLSPSAGGRRGGSPAAASVVLFSFDQLSELALFIFLFMSRLLQLRFFFVMIS